MKSSGRIIEEYYEADLEKRLYLFLECPSLRREFIEIDLSGNRRESQAEKNQAAVREVSFFSRWFAVVANYCMNFRRP